MNKRVESDSLRRRLVACLLALRWTAQQRVSQVNETTNFKALLIFTMLLCGCESTVSFVTETPATWEYVDCAWGGLAVETVEYSPDIVTIKFKTGLHTPTQIDSAICICGGSLKIREHSFLVQLKRCVCSPSVDSTKTFQVYRPASGIYTVVYDDKGASYPEIGKVTVP